MRAEAGGGLDEIRAGELRQQCRRWFSVVVEKRGFQNHFHDGAVTVRCLHHGLDILAHGFDIAAAKLADIHHHVDFLRALAHGGLGLGYFDFGRAGAQWKSDHRADFDRRPGQLRG